MSTWPQRLHKFTWQLENRVDAWKYQFREALGLHGDWQVQLYHGYANESSVFLTGRVLQNRNIAVDRHDSFLVNLLNAYKRLGSREAPFAEVELEIAGQRHLARSDDEGYFALQLSLPEAWKHQDLTVAATLRAPAISEEVFRGKAFSVPPTATMGIISDVDDTIMVTGATSLRQTARWTLLHNAHTRRRLEGVAAWYQALQLGRSGFDRNPFFYVSSSPWNFFDLLDDFIRVNDIPAGPLLLRDYGIDEVSFIAGSHSSHKIERCEALITHFPQLRFLLIGDAGQEDALIYQELLQRHPKRLAGAIIRSVPNNPQEERVKRLVKDAEQRGLPMRWISHSEEGLAHCQDFGLL